MARAVGLTASPCVVVIVMMAVPANPELAVDVAVIVTWLGLGMDAGAVYFPLLLIVPFDDPPLMDHVKPELGWLGRYAANCASWPTGTLAVPG
jgi:hypothetical protein